MRPRESPNERSEGEEAASERARRSARLGGQPPQEYRNEARKTEAGRDGATSSNTRKGRDRNAAIRISLEQHAERVAKKQRTCGGTGTDTKTAAQRLAEIRSRVLAKSAADERKRIGVDAEEEVQMDTVERDGNDRGRDTEGRGASSGGDIEEICAGGRPETGYELGRGNTPRRN